MTPATRLEAAQAAERFAQIMRASIDTPGHYDDRVDQEAGRLVEQLARLGYVGATASPHTP